MSDTAQLDAIASRLLTAQPATRGARRLANVAIELGEPVDTAGISAIFAELREAYRQAHDVLVRGEPTDVVYLAAQLDRT
jgi:hypothetical protein